MEPLDPPALSLEALAPSPPSPGTSPLRRESRWAVLALLVASCAALVVGWKAFWFLTDDAYITFRYASNHRQGHGYVWNAPPFAPVEGYTSFGWMILLDALWSGLGVEPPQSANVISLVFAMGSLAVTVSLLRRTLPSWWPGSARLAALAVFLSFLVANRTFLAWTSSGLETALFQFLLLLWVRCSAIESAPTRIVAMSFVALALALTRPDGLLFCAATLALAFIAIGLGAGVRTMRAALLACFPLVGAGAHLLWRHAKYGAWLPNTYAAKFVGLWPESGIRYAFCFVVEYGLWVALALVALAWVRSVAQRSRWSATASMVAGSLAMHAAYYTFVIGGDHFEYRVYVHLLPLTCVAMAWAFARLALPPRRALLLALALLAASLPIPWTHWSLSRGLESRPDTHRMTIAVAPAFPPPFSSLLRLFDDAQAWLIERHVCMRHQEHLVFWKKAVRNAPSRSEGMRIPHEGLPVLAMGSVGVVAWMFPHVSIIDMAGLNDRVIARTPVRKDQMRRMAHDRQPPAGYIESFRPDFDFEGTLYPPDGTRVLMEVGRYRWIERRIPLTAGEVRTQEESWKARIEVIRRIVERTGKVH